MEKESNILIKGFLLGCVNPLNYNFEDEYKNTPDYLMTQALKEKWDIYQDNLKEFDELCTKVNISIGEYIIFGSVGPSCIACRIKVSDFYKANNLKFSSNKLVAIKEGKPKKVKRTIMVKAPGILGLFGKKVEKEEIAEVTDEEVVYSKVFKETISELNKLLKPLQCKFSYSKSGFQEDPIDRLIIKDPLLVDSTFEDFYDISNNLILYFSKSSNLRKMDTINEICKIIRNLDI